MEAPGGDTNNHHHRETDGRNEYEEWGDRTVEDTHGVKAASRAKHRLGSGHERKKDVGTAPSSCSGLISGPSARHGTKQTGESRVRAAHRTTAGGEGEQGGADQHYHYL